MDYAPITFAVQIMFVGAFGFFSILLANRLRGGPVLFETPHRQFGSLLFCIGMCAWEFWWMLRWALKVTGNDQASAVFVENVGVAFGAPMISAVGLAVYLSDVINPVFRKMSLPIAFLVVVGPLVAGVALG